jgi:hypothetical protein
MKKYVVDCLMVLLLLGLTACLQNQHSGAVAITGAACSDCHMPDYNRANGIVPNHSMNELQCDNCHSDTAWKPTIGHPEANFHIAADSAHTNIACADCHKPALGRNRAGANTDCINTACHLQSDIDPNHAGRSGYAWNGSKHNFCLTCHPDGTAASASSHPEAKFPIQRGAHQGVACANCHLSALGANTAGMNVSCVESGCHPQSRVDRQHTDVGNYRFDTTNKHFCRDCHPTGRNN